MTPQLRAVIRTAMQGFVFGVILALGQTQLSSSNSVDMNWLKALAISLVSAGVMGAISALHNFVIDPSKIPSLAPPTTKAKTKAKP